VYDPAIASAGRLSRTLLGSTPLESDSRSAAKKLDHALDGCPASRSSAHILVSSLVSDPPRKGDISSILCQWKNSTPLS